MDFSHLTISTNKKLLNLKLIHDYLKTESYWAKGRASDAIHGAIKNSLCFGVYFHEKQIGFARVVTDYNTHAWIMDFFIISQFRGVGIGKLLITKILSDPKFKNLEKWGLRTSDAHSFYGRFGFKNLEEPNTFMELILK